LARELAAAKREFIVVDRDHEKIREAAEHGYLVLAGDASDEEILLAAGVERCETVATVLPDDATNVFITLTVRQLTPGVEIIARAEDPRTEKKLIRGGATRVVLPAAIGAQRIANLITRTGTEEFLGQEAQQTDLRGGLERIGLATAEREERTDRRTPRQRATSMRSTGTLSASPSSCATKASLREPMRSSPCPLARRLRTHSVSPRGATR